MPQIHQLEALNSLRLIALHRMRSGAHRITVMVTEQTRRAGIDPRNLLIDVEGDDNRKEITRIGVKAETGSLFPPNRSITGRWHCGDWSNLA